MEYSKTKLDSIKESFAKSGIHYDNDEDYIEAVNNLVGYFDVLIQMDLQQKAAIKAEQENKDKISE
jgi:hypothetical protein